MKQFILMDNTAAYMEFVKTSTYNGVAPVNGTFYACVYNARGKDKSGIRVFRAEKMPEFISFCSNTYSDGNRWKGGKELDIGNDVFGFDIPPYLTMTKGAKGTRATAFELLVMEGLQNLFPASDFVHVGKNSNTLDIAEYRNGILYRLYEVKGREGRIFHCDNNDND